MEQGHSSGVDYCLVDPMKVEAQKAARQTAGHVKYLGLRFVTESMGSCATLIEGPDCYWAPVQEGLGTKTLVADAMLGSCQHTYYAGLAVDTVAAIVNDMITQGALPVVVNMFLAVGESQWFTNESRYRDLIQGWAYGCSKAHCSWAGGETQVLDGLLQPGTALLAGSGWGVIKPKESRIKDDIQPGDRIVLLASSGIHANGLTKAREVALNLSDGFLTKMPNGQTFGEGLLTPSNIYVPVIRDCLHVGVDIHGAAHITGHGWAKLMRPLASYAYVVTHLPEPQPAFRFIQEQSRLTDREAYATFNMGTGFALYVPSSEVARVIETARNQGIEAWDGGYIDASKEKKVILTQKGIEYTEADLAIR